MSSDITQEADRGLLKAVKQHISVPPKAHKGARFEQVPFQTDSSWVRSDVRRLLCGKGLLQAVRFLAPPMEGIVPGKGEQGLASP